MKTFIFVFSVMLFPMVVVGQNPFKRGDANADGRISISDPVVVLKYLFMGGSVNCLNSADVDDNGKIELSDPIGLLGYLFLGTVPPYPPFKDCGYESNISALTCKAFMPCEVTNYSLHFDGIDDYLEIPYTPVYAFHDGIAIVFWLYLDSSSDGCILNKWADGSEDHKIDILGEGHLRFRILRQDGSPLLTSKAPIPTKQWVHIACTYDSKAIKLYIDGKLDSQQSGTSPIKISEAPVRIGAIFRDSVLLNPFKGKIDGLAIFNRGLIEEEVSSFFEGNIPAAIDGLIGLYYFDEGTGKVAKDISSNQDNGNLGKSPAAPTWAPGYIK